MVLFNPGYWLGVAQRLGKLIDDREKQRQDSIKNRVVVIGLDGESVPFAKVDDNWLREHVANVDENDKVQDDIEIMGLDGERTTLSGLKEDWLQEHVRKYV